MIEIFMDMNLELRTLILTCIVIWLYMEWEDSKSNNDKE